jgi:multidrug transporter EmrE-like cation transporter
MSGNTFAFLILFGGGILLTIGDIIFKYWTGHEKPWLYAIGLAFYLAGLIPLIESYKYQNIEVASAVLVLFNIIILTFVGYLYFNEKIGWLEVFGLLAACIAIVCLEFAT